MEDIQIGNLRVRLGNNPLIEHFDAVVTVLFFGEKLVLVKNRQRAWEFPGGRREGDETYAQTATREAFEEAGACIAGITYLGYYTTPDGHVTVIACAEATCLGAPGEAAEMSKIGLFDQLPPDLSFADGREPLFVESAKAKLPGT